MPASYLHQFSAQKYFSAENDLDNGVICDECNKQQKHNIQCSICTFLVQKWWKFNANFGWKYATRNAKKERQSVNAKSPFSIKKNAPPKIYGYMNVLKNNNIC